MKLNKNLKILSSRQKPSLFNSTDAFLFIVFYDDVMHLSMLHWHRIIWTAKFSGSPSLIQESFTRHSAGLVTDAGAVTKVCVLHWMLSVYCSTVLTSPNAACPHFPFIPAPNLCNGLCGPQTSLFLKYFSPFSFAPVLPLPAEVNRPSAT